MDYHTPWRLNIKQYIYSRVSTGEQSTDPQIMSLKEKFPSAQVVEEIASGAKKRPILETLVNNLNRGDMLIVAALDRIGRKTAEVLSLIEQLNDKGIILISDREGVDYSTPTGRLVTQILVSVSEMERNLISERTKAGMKAAKERGKVIGRKPYIPNEVKQKAIDLVLVNRESVRSAALKCGINNSYLASLIRNYKNRVDEISE
ncbi:MAG: recombinase family protein [Pseudobacteriovorax sp.]|nr:recombinase family protein [Pseudobacteriovorax sp.]